MDFLGDICHKFITTKSGWKDDTIMGYYVMFEEDLSVADAIRAHNQPYPSVLTARADVFKEEGAGKPFKVVDSQGNIAWQGISKEPTAIEGKVLDEKGLEMVMQMVQLARAGKSYRHLLKELKEVAKVSPKTRELIELLAHNLEG